MQITTITIKNEFKFYVLNLFESEMSVEQAHLPLLIMNISHIFTAILFLLIMNEIHGK